MSRLGSQPSTQPVRGLRCDNTMVFQGAEPLVWLPGISSVWMPCMLRSSIMASQSIEVCSCRMLCVFVRFRIFLVPKESVYRSCHNVKNGPKRTQKKNNFSEKPGSLFGTCHGPKPVLLVGLCFGQVIVDAMRRFSKHVRRLNEGSLGDFFDSPVMTCHC